jgi:hypothetical protein
MNDVMEDDQDDNDHNDYDDDHDDDMNASSTKALPYLCSVWIVGIVWIDCHSQSWSLMITRMMV